MLPTPSTSHVSFDSIYEPAEDSYLFLDTLSSVSEKSWLQSRFPGPGVPLVCELGPGSGVIIAFLTAHARVIFGHDILSLAVDVNPLACKAARATVLQALQDTNSSGTNRSFYLASLNGDLTTTLRPNSVDVLVFNPPYVPTDAAPALTVNPVCTAKPTFDESSHLLALSYAGGQDGMEVTDRLFTQLPGILAPNGVAYVLLCRGNNPPAVKERINAWPSDSGRKWTAKTVGDSGKTAGWEKLEIVRICRERESNAESEQG